MVLLAATAAKHLVEEAKLRGHAAREGDEEESEDAHYLRVCVYVMCVKRVFAS